MASIGVQLAKVVVKKLLGRLPTFPHLGSNTMGKDDVRIVKQWQKNRARWFNRETVDRFGSEFAAWNGSAYGYAFMGGRVALSACISALGLGPGDEVIVPGYTCIVVPNAFKNAGIDVVYADIELDTFGLSAQRAAEKITAKTKAILIHHLYGLVCRDYEALLALAREYRLMVIEDCAQAAGAVYKGKKVGNRGDVAFYSSEQSKCFTTSQGGVATTNNEEIAARLKKYYLDAPFPPEERVYKLLTTLRYNYYAYVHRGRWFLKDWLGYRYGGNILVSTTAAEVAGRQPVDQGCKMPAPLAAVGLNQLAKLDRCNEARRANAHRWDRWCRENNYNPPLILPGSEPVYLRYPVMVEPENKSNPGWLEEKENIRHGLWFQTNLHPAPSALTGCPGADSAAAKCINLPTLGL